MITIVHLTSNLTSNLTVSREKKLQKVFQDDDRHHRPTGQRCLLPLPPPPGLLTPLLKINTRIPHPVPNPSYCCQCPLSVPFLICSSGKSLRHRYFLTSKVQERIGLYFKIYLKSIQMIQDFCPYSCINQPHLSQ